MKNRTSAFALLFAAMSFFPASASFAQEPTPAPSATPRAAAKKSTQLSDFEILKLDYLTAGEMKSLPIPFSGHIEQGNGSLMVQIHNPYRDRTIYGVVVVITGKDSSSQDGVKLTVFVPVQAGPLQHGARTVDIYKGESLEQPESNTAVKLLEVHYKLGGSDDSAAKEEDSK